MVKKRITQFCPVHPSRSLTDLATDTLRQAILKGYFEPGDRLDQDAIAHELEISRTPIRGAIVALESEGLLESRPHHGVFVTTVSKKDIRDIYALRALLEAEMVRQAAASIPETTLDALDSMLREAQRAYEKGDTVGQFEADRQFHETLRGFVRNQLLKKVLAEVENRVLAVRRFAQTKPGEHIDQFAQEHLTIVDALRQRDAARASKLMVSHLNNSGERLQELVAD